MYESRVRIKVELNEVYQVHRAYIEELQGLGSKNSWSTVSDAELHKEMTQEE